MLDEVEEDVDEEEGKIAEVGTREVVFEEDGAGLLDATVGDTGMEVEVIFEV